DGILGLRNSRFNLTTSPKEPTMAPASKPLPTSSMFGIELSLAEHYHASEAQAAINEYSSSHAQLRREGITLARYVATYRKDNGDNEPMPHKLCTACDKLQVAFGAVANLSNPLASV